MCSISKTGWRAGLALRIAAKGTDAGANLAIDPLGLEGTSGLCAVGALDDLGHKAGLCDQLEGHLVVRLYLVSLGKKLPSLQTATRVTSRLRRRCGSASLVLERGGVQREIRLQDCILGTWVKRSINFQPGGQSCAAVGYHLHISHWSYLLL